MPLTDVEAMILARVVRPIGENLSTVAAKELLRLDFQEPDHIRMAELSAKAQEGKLSKSETDELEGYVNISHLIAFAASERTDSNEEE